MMDAELGGDGPGAPMLGVEEAAHLGVLRLQASSTIGPTSIQDPPLGRSGRRSSRFTRF
jgi:hypothetical protein